jgi:hypothetical protein
MYGRLDAVGSCLVCLQAIQNKGEFHYGINIRRQTLQGFPLRVKCSSMKTVNQLAHITAFLARSRELTVTYNCTGERTLLDLCRYCELTYDILFESCDGYLDLQKMDLSGGSPMAIT